MGMLGERDSFLCNYEGVPGRKPSKFWNTFFMSKLYLDNKNTYCFDNVRRWTKKIDIFMMDKLFVPINIDNCHWTLAIVYMQEKQICYYDSFGGYRKDLVNVLLRWIIQEAKERKNLSINQDEWRFPKSEEKVPKQYNGCDCGVFTILFANFKSDDLPFDFDHTEINAYRFKIADSILRGYFGYNDK
jgi:sentrin-specific protease 1